MKIGIYEVLELLGDGGMGSVYRCRDPRFDREVAVKVLHPHFQRNPDVVVRFKTEAVVQAKLSHPHIVSVYDFLADGSNLAIVMELVEGGSAERLLAIGGPLAMKRGLRLFEQVLGAIGHAHERALVHRDVKPSNILVQQAGGSENAKVVDFGIAKIVGSDRQQTATAAKLGTLAYMSPEQVKSSRSVDARSDIYSLGVTLQQLLTGTLPFDGEGDFEVMRAILEDEPAPPRLDGKPLPERIDRAIRKALLRDPDQRFQSCREFQEGLRSGVIELPETLALTSAPGRSRPEPATSKQVSEAPARRAWPRRLLRPLAAGTFALLLLGAGATGWLVYQGAEERAALAQEEARRTREQVAEEARRLREEADAQVQEERKQRQREDRDRQLREEQERQRLALERERAEDQQRALRDQEQRRLAAARRELQGAVQRARTDLGRGELEAAKQGLESARSGVPRDLRAHLDGDLAAVQEQLLEIDRRLLERAADLRAEEAQAAARRRVFEDQLALARSHLDARRFPEARSLSETLLEQPGLPAELREQAEALVRSAKEGLEGAWKDAGVGSPTEKKKKRPDNR